MINRFQKTSIFIAGLLTCSCPIIAQPAAWSLDSCMSYAISHATAMKRETTHARQRQQDYQKAITNFLPQVSARVSGQYAWGRNIDPETNTYNDVTTFNNYYELYASISVFDGLATFNAFRQARLTRNYSQTARQKVEDDTAIDVMQKFVEAVYAKESILLAKEKLDESRRILQKTQKLYDLGEKSRPDVVQIEAQVAEDEYNLIHQQHTAQQSLLALKTAMNFPVEKELTLTSKKLSDKTHGKTYTDGEDLFFHFQRISPDIKTATYEVGRALYDYKIAKGRLLPSLSLNGGIATNYYRNISQQSGQYDRFAAQLKNNRGEYLALTLSIPIFNADRLHNMKRARNDWQLALINLEETQRQVHDKVVQAAIDAEDYAQELQQMEKKVASDSLAYHMTSRKFEEGMLSTFDLHTTAQTLLESRIKCLQMQLMLAIKRRLTEYYQGEKIIRSTYYGHQN